MEQGCLFETRPWTTDKVRMTLFHKFESRVSYRPWFLAVKCFPWSCGPVTGVAGPKNWVGVRGEGKEKIFEKGKISEMELLNLFGFFFILRDFNYNVSFLQDMTI